jgi:Na+/H+-dicarboxylate symporter
MAIVRYAMRLAPVAVFGLMAQLTTKLGLEALVGMSVYVGTAIVGLLLLLVLYVAIVALFTKLNPWSYLQAVREVQLLAFSTSSSAAVMPISIKTAEEKLGVRPSVAQFVIPLGATINMNGTALYQGVATIFLAQVFGVDLSTSALVLVVVTAVAASIGSPATPGVGIVILSMVLAAAGVPAAGIGLIIGVDRIIDMTRTAVNVTGDLVAAVVLDRAIGGKLSAEDQLQREAEQEMKRERGDGDVLVEEPATAG